MFYYFGRKGRLARFYPPPRYPLVVEPFAGSAAYTLHWKPADAIVADREWRDREWAKFMVDATEPKAEDMPCVPMRHGPAMRCVACAPEDPQLDVEPEPVVTEVGCSCGAYGTDYVCHIHGVV